MDFEDSVHLDPELTFEDVGRALFQGVKEGRLSEADVVEFIRLGQSETTEPRINRIFAKALATFLLMIIRID